MEIVAHLMQKVLQSRKRCGKRGIIIGARPLLSSRDEESRCNALFSRRYRPAEVKAEIEVTKTNLMCQVIGVERVKWSRFRVIMVQGHPKR